jgi:hypothetical protein
MESLSQWELCKLSLEGGFRTGDPEGYVKQGSGNGHVFIGASLGNLGEGFVYRGLREEEEEEKEKKEEKQNN